MRQRSNSSITTAATRRSPGHWRPGEFYPEGVYNERIVLNRRIASVYIGAAQDRTILPAWQQTMARQRLDIEPIMIESGHCPNVSRPRELGALLLEVAKVRK
jgi:hypothetical protein